MNNCAPPVPHPALEAESIRASTEALLQTLATSPPLVQNITNWVAMDLSANALLAIGASPAMVAAQAEAAEFTARASSLVINIGTFEESWRAAAAAAAQAAQDKSVPWVLDPVAVGVTRFRTDNARALCGFAPTAIRANASEVLALATALSLEEAAPSRARGVDAGDTVAAAQTAAGALARHLNAVVCVTGTADFVCDATGTSFMVSGGVPLTARVTATGCALSATVAAFLAVANKTSGKTQVSNLLATALAAALFSYAGERAATGLAASASGSFRVGFVDALGFATSRDGQDAFADFAAQNLRLSSAMT